MEAGARGGRGQVAQGPGTAVIAVEDGAGTDGEAVLKHGRVRFPSLLGEKEHNWLKNGSYSFPRLVGRESAMPSNVKWRPCSFSRFAGAEFLRQRTNENVEPMTLLTRIRSCWCIDCFDDDGGMFLGCKIIIKRRWR